MLSHKMIFQISQSRNGKKTTRESNLLKDSLRPLAIIDKRQKSHLAIVLSAIC